MRGRFVVQSALAKRSTDDGETVREGSGAPVGVFQFPQTSWKRLRTTNIIIERCFVEVRRRTRPMVCFVNVQSVDRIIYSIFHCFNLGWKRRPLEIFTQAA